MEGTTFEDLWPSMRPIISMILRGESLTREEYQDLFWAVHRICHWDDQEGPDKLYRNLQNITLDYIAEAQQRVLVHQKDLPMLNAYIEEWSKFSNRINYVVGAFDQLELALLGHNTRRVRGDFLRKFLLDTWSESIFSNIEHRFQTFATQLVHSERNGELVDSLLVIAVKDSYVKVCSDPEDKFRIYREKFERAYIDATKDFYRVKAMQYFCASGAKNYMKYAEQKLKEEEQRASKYLESVSIGLFTETCDEVFITAFKEAIFAEYAGMVKGNEIEKLQLMLNLMDRVPNGVVKMLNELEDHIVDKGLADMLDFARIIYQKGEKYVEQLLELYARFSKLVSEAFNNDPRFLTSRDKAFERILKNTSVFELDLTRSEELDSELSESPSKKMRRDVTQMPTESYFPKLFANYCDTLLRKTPLSRKLTSDDIKTRLKQVAGFLKYVKNKDVFMVYYESHLRRRLILDISAESETERCMVDCLRDIRMPADYVIKLARMFRDIKVCKDLNEQFKFTHRNNPGLADALNIKILKADAWPSRASERVQVSLPSELTHFIPPVNEFYRQQHNGRKLQWYHRMSNGTIAFTNKAGKYDLEVTTFQMAVLLAWNEKLDKISFEDLRLATQLPQAELRRTLWSLAACPKLKRQFLLHSPEVKSAEDFKYRTLFWINQDFSLIKNGKPQTKGKVNLIGKLQLSTEQSRQEENEAILRLRIFKTQETIVQIMKMRKKIINAQLRNQLIQVLENQFLPSANLIEEQTEFLIEHGYLRRAQENRNIFVRTP